MTFTKMTMIAVAALGVACGSTPMTGPAATTLHAPSSDGADMNAALVVRAYEGLTKKHILPTDARRVAVAGLAALSGGADQATGFGDDLSTNATLLQQRAHMLLTREPDASRARNAVWTAIRAMIDAADDPHAMLLGPGLWESLLDVLQGKPATPPGIAFTALADGRLVAIDVDASGPGAKAGFKPGDVLVAIDGHPVSRLADIMDLYGRAERTVTPVRVRRPGVAAPIDLRYQSVAWTMPVADGRMLAGNIGYLRLHLCAFSAANAVRAELDELQRAGARALVLDLRGNPGGVATAIVSIFSPADPIGITRDLAGKEQSEGRSGDAWSHPLPTVVLVDGGTFSGAELVAFELQDLAAARVLGTPTAGGLSGVDNIELADGYLLHFANELVVGARSHATPAGHRVTPDETLPERSPQDIAAGVDHQLETALDELGKTVTPR